MSLKKGLSICMIVKNEEKWLDSCLSSAKKWADEIIICDTGSTDRSVEIAKKYTDNVFSHKWVDFSDARNASVRDAKYDYIFTLDADEYLDDDQWERLKKSIDGARKLKAALAVYKRNYTNTPAVIGMTYCKDRKPAVGWVPSLVLPIFPNGRGLYFEGVVHESVARWCEENKIKIVTDLEVFIHHMGRIDKVHLGEKGRHYYELGKKKLADCRDIVSVRELAIQAAELGIYDDSEKYWREAIEMEPTMAWHHLNLCSTLAQCERYEEALKEADISLTLDPNNRDAFYNKGLCEFYLGKGVQASMSAENAYNQDKLFRPAQTLYVMSLVAANVDAMGETPTHERMQLLMHHFGNAKEEVSGIADNLQRVGLSTEAERLRAYLV
jgi:glycosyltransferase involved in cell wall biosynthesis